MAWADGSPTEAALQASVDGSCRVRAAGLADVRLEGRPVPVTRAADGSLTFEGEAGKTYQLVFGG